MHTSQVREIWVYICVANSFNTLCLVEGMLIANNNDCGLLKIVCKNCFYVNAGCFREDISKLFLLL